MDRKHLWAGDRRLSYLEAGRSDGALGTVILVHAFPLSASMWEPQLDEPPEGWQLLAPDLRGFGESFSGHGGKPAGARRPADDTIDTMDAMADAVSLDEYVEDVVHLLGRLKINSAVIGGLSMGGYVTLAIFRRAPAYFRAMILADTRAQADTEEARIGRQKMLELIERAGAAGVADDMLPKLLAPDTHRARPELVQRVRALIEANAPAGIEGALRRMMSRPDSTPVLSRIPCPTLLIVGEQDTLTPPAESRAMHDRIPRSTLRIIPGAGHLSNLEQPAEFNRTVAEFLSAAL